MRASRWALLFFSYCLALSVGCSNRRDTGPLPDCETSANCTDAAPICLQGTCVPCAETADCDCHEVCDSNECVPLGADRAPQPGQETTFANNAHGQWDGTPGNADYRFVTLCENNADCGIGQLCNPFTAGCIAAADFVESCSGGRACPSGLECEPNAQLCLPPALCRASSNCCGGDGFVCDAVPGNSGLCVPPAEECTPPDEVVASCPFFPKDQAECAGGEFCSTTGRCVQCLCDNDCQGGLKCYADNTCRSQDFCRAAAECDQPIESCDLDISACRPRCDAANEDTVCGAQEYCRAEDDVCRPITELPCSDDSREPNNSLAEAVSNDVTLQTPSLGTTVLVQSLSLCENDEDWFRVELSQGNHLIVFGQGLGQLSANMEVYAPDQSTVLASGFFANDGSDLVEFTANADGVYFLRVFPFSALTGFYNLSMSLVPGEACLDPFETSEGVNNLPAQATALYSPDEDVTPSDCTTSATSGSQTVFCDDVLELCEGDVDYFEIAVPNGGDLEVKLTEFSGNLNLRLDGPFADEEVLSLDRPVAVADGTQLTEIVRTTARPAGRYLLQVARSQGERSGYDLEVEVTTPLVACVEDDYDHPDSPGLGAPVPATVVVDPSGFNDSAENATQVVVQTGVYSFDATPLALCRADKDWFEFGDNDGSDNVVALPADRRVTVEVVPVEGSNGVITVAGGFDSEAMTFGSIDPSQPQQSFTVSRTDGTQTLLVAVVGHPDNTSSIDYTLNVTVEEPPACAGDALGDIDGDENGVLESDNDAPARAIVLGEVDGWPVDIGDRFEYVSDPGAPLSLCADDDDWYRITVPAGARALVWVNADPTEADIGLGLFNGSVSEINEDTNGVLPTSGQLDSMARDGAGYQRTIAKLSSGTAYIMVYNRTGWPLGDYGMGVEFLPGDCTEDVFDTTDPTVPPNNNAFDRATPVPLAQLPADRQVELGVLDPLAICTQSGGERDYYSVPLGAGDQVQTRVYYDPSQGALNLSLQPPGPAGLGTIIDNDSGGGFSTGELEVSYTVQNDDPSGAYLLLVQPSGPPDNTYFIETIVTRACEDDDLEPVPPAELALTSWTPNYTPAELRLCKDDDWFEVPVADGVGSITFCASFVHDEGDIDMRVFDSIDTSTPASPVGDDLLGSSQMKTDWERVYLERAVTTAATYFVQLTLDPRDVVDTDYRLWLLEGDVSCPPVFCIDAAGCSNQGSCNTAANGGAGACECDVGFDGDTCDVCEAGFFGGNCDPCACDVSETCDDGISGGGTCTPI